MTQTDILFFHNFWIFHLWDHFFGKKLGEGGGRTPPRGGRGGGRYQDCVPKIHRILPVIWMECLKFRVFEITTAILFGFQKAILFVPPCPLEVST